MTKYETIPLDLIDANSQPIRQSLGDDGINGVSALSASIAEMGVMQPIRVMPHTTDEGRYEIVFGHRRHAAAGEAGLSDVPAIIIPRPDRLTYLKMALDENTKRQNMTERERAEAEAALKAEMEKAGQVKVNRGPSPIGVTVTPTYAATRAAQTRESEPTIEKYVKVGEATPAVKEALDTKLLTFAAAADVAGETPDVQEKTIERLREQGVKKADAARTSRVSEAIKSEAPTRDCTPLGNRVGYDGFINPLDERVPSAPSLSASDSNKGLY